MKYLSIPECAEACGMISTKKIYNAVRGGELQAKKVKAWKDARPKLKVKDRDLYRWMEEKGYGEKNIQAES